MSIATDRCVCPEVGGIAHCPWCQSIAHLYRPDQDAVNEESRLRPVYRKAQIPAAIRRAVFERDAYRCVEPGCGTWLDLTLDHVIPEILGGPATVENLRTLCRSHNSQKGTR